MALSIFLLSEVWQPCSPCHARGIGIRRQGCSSIIRACIAKSISFPATLHPPGDLPVRNVRAAIEAVAADLMVDITLKDD